MSKKHTFSAISSSSGYLSSTLFKYSQMSVFNNASPNLALSIINELNMNTTLRSMAGSRSFDMFKVRTRVVNQSSLLTISKFKDITENWETILFDKCINGRRTMLQDTRNRVNEFALDLFILFRFQEIHKSIQSFVCNKLYSLCQSYAYHVHC